MLNYKGYTYAPVRSVFSAAGLNVGWNAELNQATVNTPAPDTEKPNAETTAPTTTETTAPEITPESILPETTTAPKSTAPESTAPESTAPADTAPATESEPAVVDYISDVITWAVDETHISVSYPELMDVSTVLDVSNYKIYERDGVTLAATQPVSAEYTHLQYTATAYLTLSSAFDKVDIFILEVSPNIKNTNGTKFVKNSDGSPIGKIQFASPGFTGN